MSSAEQLFLLADHIRLSLLERQRAQSLGLDSDSQDGHLSRSLEQFSEGLKSLEAERDRLQQGGDARYAELTPSVHCCLLPGPAAEDSRNDSNTALPLVAHPQ